MCDRHILSTFLLLFSFSSSATTGKAEVPTVIFEACSNLERGKQTDGGKERQNHPFLMTLKEALNQSRIACLNE